MPKKPYQRSLMISFNSYYRLLIVLVRGTRKWEWSWRHRRTGILKAGDTMRHFELVQWPMDNDAAEDAALKRIEQLEGRGYRRAYPLVQDGMVTWKMVAPPKHDPAEGFPILVEGEQ